MNNTILFSDVVRYVRSTSASNLTALAALVASEQTFRENERLAALPAVSDTERGLVNNGQFVEAVKSYRNRTRENLRTCVHVMRKTAEYKRRNPE